MSSDEDPLVLEADVIHESGSAIGVLTLESAGSEGVRMVLRVDGLVPGTHAVHLHARAACDAPGFFSAGGHFDPINTRHGKPDTDADVADPQHHAGDMLNQQVDANGALHTAMVNRSVALMEGRNRLLDANGAALIIYARADDYRTQPIGSGGRRVACAAIDLPADEVGS